MTLDEARHAASLSQRALGNAVRRHSTQPFVRLRVKNADTVRVSVRSIRVPQADGCSMALILAPDCWSGYSVIYLVACGKNRSNQLERAGSRLVCTDTSPEVPMHKSVHKEPDRTLAYTA